ncbi:hypothetical protein C4577_06610 [Candidatus Parcubacteria bacterium]|nr:MAG: hypothetical protein C4577_06610 [Candidatus Parcubacteria bacterium]
MKIVMEYSEHGGYECGCYEHVLCFEYESKEAFIIDFEICLNEVRLNRFFYKKNREEWDKEKPALKNNVEKAREWLGKQPNRPSDKFEFCGQKFDYENFVIVGEWESPSFIKENEQFELPEVYELDEWWQAKRLN